MTGSAPVTPIVSPRDWQMRLPGPLAYRFYRKSKAARARAAAASFDHVLATLGPGSISLDLGANVGIYTRRLAATGAQVHAFEPDPDTAALLREAVADCPNVTVHEAAVAAEPGTVRLYRSKNYLKNPRSKSLGSSVARTDPFAMDLRSPIEVAQIDILAFIEALPRPVELVKMDVEGSEWPILDAIADGRAQDRIGHLFVETHERFDTWRLMPRLRRLMAFAEVAERPKLDLNWI